MTQFGPYMTEGFKDNKAIAAIVRELQQTKDAAKTLAKLATGKQVSNREQEELEDQAKDIAIGLGYAAIFAVPGGSVLLPIVRYIQGKK